MFRVNSRGQQFAMDFLVGVSLFILLISLTFQTWEKNIYRIQEKETLEDLLIVSHQVADMLVKTKGMPSNWEENPDTSKSIGLVRDAERMIDERTGEIWVGHSVNPVPFILVGEDFKGVKLRKDGTLGSVAPTVYQVYDIKKSPKKLNKGLIK